MNEILYLVLFILGILNLILFFKIWGMTNDVKSIKNILSENKENEVKGLGNAKIEALLGNYDEAYSFYKKSFISDVLFLYYNYDQIPTYYDRHYGDLIKKYQVYLNALEGNYSIDFEKYNSKDKVKKLIIKN